MTTMELWQLAITFGIPTTFTGIMFGFLKSYIDNKDKENKEYEKNKEHFMVLLLKTTRANSLLSEAIAKAVSNIPESNCNGEMTAALKYLKQIQIEEKDFLMDNGIKHIFDDR